jgi:alpha-glucosidase
MSVVCSGVTEKLEHLKDIGVGGVWLSPIFKSPMADFGYDISDFKDIDPMFGTLSDFDHLLHKAKDLGK